MIETFKIFTYQSTTRLFQREHRFYFVLFIIMFGFGFFMDIITMFSLLESFSQSNLS
jgi:ABC-type maltose transport system permease subunit